MYNMRNKKYDKWGVDKTSWEVTYRILFETISVFHNKVALLNDEQIDN